MNKPNDIQFLHAATARGIFQWPKGYWILPHENRISLAAEFANELKARFENLEFPQHRHALAVFLNGKHVAELSETLPQDLPAIDTRILIYHVCPIIHNDGCRHNVHQLTKRWSVFNGKRVVAIARGQGLELPATVIKAFGNNECEFVELPNDPQLREVATFLPLLLSVANTNSNEATFYAHTKGNSTAENAKGAMYWRNLMYHKLLNQYEECMQDLQHHAFVGVHKLVWPHGAVPPYPTRLQRGHWMLAGTFYWFRNDLVFGHKEWRNISNDRYGAEAWPSGMFEPQYAKSRFQSWPENEYPTPSPYDPNLYLESQIDDEELPIEQSATISVEAWNELVHIKRPNYELEIPAAKIFRKGIPGPKTAIVIGAYRGGTSFAAECLQELHIPKGQFRTGTAEKWAYCNFEDIDFKEPLDTKNYVRFAELIEIRNREHPNIWGMKNPTTIFHLDVVLPMFRNPHLIVVTRDPLAAQQGDAVRSNRVDLIACRNHSAKVLDCLTSTRAPTLAICFERGKNARNEVKIAIQEFLRCESA